MSPLNYLMLLGACFLLVFAQSHVLGLPRLLGVQLDLTPGFLVCAALRCDVWRLTGLALAAGLFLDALSANRLGASLLPLFLVAWVVQRLQDVLLRDSISAWLTLGCLAGAAVPLLGWLMLLGGTPEQHGGLEILWPIAILAAANALATPFWFWLFGRLDRAFNYAALPESTFRADREIKRGRL